MMKLLQDAVYSVYNSGNEQMDNEKYTPTSKRLQWWQITFQHQVEISFDELNLVNAFEGW